MACLVSNCCNRATLFRFVAACIFIQVLFLMLTVKSPNERQRAQRTFSARTRTGHITAVAAVNERESDTSTAAKHWHPISPFHKFDYIILNVYFDFRNRNPVLWLYGFRDCRADMLEKAIYARFQNVQMNRTELVSLTLGIGGRKCRDRFSPKCSWTPMTPYVSVNITESTVEPSLPVTLSVDKTFSNQTKIIEIMPFITRKPQKGQSYKHTLAICVQPIYYFGDLIAFVQFIELWKLLGADYFYIYVISVTRDVHTLLEAYQREGLLEIIPWPLLPKEINDDPNRQIFRYGGELGMNDCLMRASGKVEFTGMFDLDEYLVPWVNYTMQTDKKWSLVELIRQALPLNGNAGSITFDANKVDYPPNGSSYLPETVQGANFNFNYLYDLTVATGFAGPPKVLGRPDKIILTSTHVIKKSADGVKQRSKNKVIKLYHVRKNPSLWGRKNRQYWKEQYMQQYIPAMTANINAFISRNFPAHKVWNTGDGIHQQYLIGHCLSNWQKYGCQSPTALCQHVINDTKLFSWVTYESTYNSSVYYVLPT